MPSEPVDPFAGDPDDPAREMAALDDDLEADPPLTPDAREGVLGDLEDLEVFQALLSPRGVRGLVTDCLDCQEPHYFDWDLLRGTMRSVLDRGRPPVHEPAHAPDPGAYVSWDYARGYADGVTDASSEAPED